MSEEVRDGIQIITDLFHLTHEMTTKLDDEDFLIAGVERRQALMDEYDRYHGAHPDEDKGKCRGLVQKIIQMDQKIRESLAESRTEAKKQLTSSHKQQKVMSYMNNAISASGSYMDYKK